MGSKLRKAGLQNFRGRRLSESAASPENPLLPWETGWRLDLMRHASSAKCLTSDRIYVLVFFMNIVTPIDPLAQMAGSDPSPDRTEACGLFSDEAMAAQAARHVRMLQELAELAMKMARRVAA